MARRIARNLRTICVAVTTILIAATVNAQDSEVTGPGQSPQSPYPASINSVAFSPDAKLAITGSEDKIARLWDVSSGDEIRSFKGHTAAITSVAFSPDGKQVLTGSRDSTARLWEADNGREIRQYRISAKDWVNSVAFSPDGKQLLTGSRSSARLWDKATGKELGRIPDERVQTAIFSPDGKQVLVAAGDQLRLWDAATRDKLWTFDKHSTEIDSVAFSSEGKQVLSTARDGVTCLCNAADGALVRRFAPIPFANFSTLSPDGKQVIICGYSAIRFFDMSSGKETRRMMSPAFKIWTESGTGQEGVKVPHEEAIKLERPAGMITSGAISASGDWLLIGRDDGTAEVWNARAGHETQSFDINAQEIKSIAFSADGTRLLTTSQDLSARFWDVTSGKEIQNFKRYGLSSCIALSADGKRALFGSSNGRTSLWNTSDGHLIRNFDGSDDKNVYAVSAAFSRDGKQIIAGSGDLMHPDGNDRSARLFDVASGKEIRKFASPKAAVVGVAFSPDGKQALTACDDETTRLWDIASGRELRKFKPFGVMELIASSASTWTYSPHVVAVAFSADGKRIITASSNMTVRVWDVATGEELGLVCDVDQFDLPAVALSADGEQVAYAGKGDSVVLWCDCHMPPKRRFVTPNRR